MPQSVSVAHTWPLGSTAQVAFATVELFCVRDGAARLRIRIARLLLTKLRTNRQRRHSALNYQPPVNLAGLLRLPCLAAYR